MYMIKKHQSRLLKDLINYIFFDDVKKIILSINNKWIN